MDNILIIWDGEIELSQFRIDCIKRIKEIYPDVKLLCITKDDKLLPDVIDEYISWDLMEEKLWNKWFVKSHEAKVLSDYFRYLWLSENPYTLYLDTDIYIHEKFEESDYISKWENDYSALWNGNQCKFFEYIIGLRGANGSLTRLLKCYPKDCGDLGKYMSHKTKEGHNDS